MKKIDDRISLIVHTKNEERNIKDCIMSAKSLASEIVVIDMSSTDKTAEIAKSLGARVIIIPDKGFVDNYANFGFSKAIFPWILTIAADERITPALAKTLLKIIKEDKYDVVIAPRKNIRFKKWMEHGGWWPDNQVIIFKKGFVRLPENVNQAHVPFVIKGRQLILDAKEENAIVHYNIENLKHMLNKITWYYTLEGSGDFFKRNKITPKSLINYYKGEFRFRYIDKKGYLDGMRGYINAKFREYSRFLEFVNWWERKGYPEVFNQKELLETILEKGEFEDIEIFKSSKIYKLWQFYTKQKSKISALLN